MFDTTNAMLKSATWAALVHVLPMISANCVLFTVAEQNTKWRVKSQVRDFFGDQNLIKGLKMFTTCMHNKEKWGIIPSMPPSFLKRPEAMDTSIRVLLIIITFLDLASFDNAEFHSWLV